MTLEGFGELLRRTQTTQHHLGHKSSFLRVENMWIIGAKKWTECAQKRRHLRSTHKWKSVEYRVGIFRSVSVGISWYLPYRYRRKTRSVFSVSKFWREPLKKLAGAPFFLRRGGLGPLFVHFALLLKKKRNSRGIFQKKSSRENLKMCSR